MSLFHAYSQTVADGTATSVVRPSDWNSGHNQFITLSGNTAGQSTISGTNIVFQGGNNVTMSAATAAGAATIIISGANSAAQTVQPVAFSASGGSSNFSTLAFSNQANGLTFSNSAGQVAISHSLQQLSNTSAITNAAVNTSVSSLFQQTSATSAITSNAFPSGNSTNLVNTSVSSLFQQTSATSAITSNAFPSANTTKFAGTGTTFAGTNITATLGLNSNGLGLSLSGANGGGGGVPVAFSASGGSSGFTTLTFSNVANDFTFVNSGGQVAASHSLQPLSNTSAITAAAVNTSVSSLFQQTSATSAITSNAFPSANTTKFAGTGTTFAGTNITATLGLNSNGLALSLSGNAAQTVQTQNLHNVTLSGNTTGTLAAISSGTMTLAGGNNITLSQVGNAITISGVNTVAQTVQTQASGAIAGTGFTSTTTAGTAVTAALGTNGLSMAVPAFITTYFNDLTSGRAGTGFTSTSTAGVAITAALGTNGLSMAVPAFITTYVNDLTSGRAGTGTTLALTNLNGTLNVGTNGVALSINNVDANYVAWGLEGAQTAGTTGTTLTTAGALYFSGGNNVTLSGNSNTIVISAANQTVDTNKAGTGTTLNLTNLSGTLNVGSNGVALSLNNIDANLMGWELEGANTAGTTFSSMTTNAPLYLQGGANVTLSGNSNTVIINAGGGGGALTYNPYYFAMSTGNTIVGSMGQNSMYVNYMDSPENITFCHADQLVSLNIAATTSFTSFTNNGNITGTTVSAATWAMTRSLAMYSLGAGTNSTRLELMPGSSSVSLGATMGYSYALSQAATSGGVTQTYTGTHGATNGFSINAIASADLSGNITYTTIGFSATTSRAFANTSAGVGFSTITVSVANVSTSLFTGLRDFVCGLGMSVPAGNVWLAQIQSTASTTSGRNVTVLSVSQVMNTSLNVTAFRHLSETSNNATSNFMPYQGVYTVATGGFPATIGSNQVSNNTAFSNAGVPTFFMYDPFP